ncbi:hypothetical protein ETAA8_29060 [Anatilimnocola aggregata]|uniref:Uncharacterized protein n=1 Tax=Anatilimnocola aggregata TaxID=2528021 RepID=A0A517YC50_9BACT|nr:hypothetical protein ETAA8_29060 [Anatilimnocola aggregata]
MHGVGSLWRIETPLILKSALAKDSRPLHYRRFFTRQWLAVRYNLWLPELQSLAE